MPSAGGTSFLQHVETKIMEFDDHVSMPSAGGTSFLPGSSTRTTLPTVSMCQCPQRAGPHFYMTTTQEKTTLMMCQCPQRAGPHFYSDPYFAFEMTATCVNALSGRDLISTSHRGGSLMRSYIVSMPSAGGTSFLPYYFNNRPHDFPVVSMPSAGGTSFLQPLVCI